jgi:hypothetical protein
LTNKEAKKRTIVAIIAETKGDVVIYWKNPLMQRNKVSEITLDMAEHELNYQKMFP